MENRYLSIKEASEYLGLKPSSLYSMVEGKEIPHYRIKNRIKFTIAELDAWMAEQRVEVIDVEKEARKIFHPPVRRIINVKALADKSIAEVKRTEYTGPYGRPDRIRGLTRKEANDGTL